MHDTPYALPTCYYVRSRSYHMYGIWYHTAVNNVCKYGLLAI